MIHHGCETRKAEIKVGMNPMPKKVGQYTSALLGNILLPYPIPGKKPIFFNNLYRLSHTSQLCKICVLLDKNKTGDKND